MTFGFLLDKCLYSFYFDLYTVLLEDCFEICFKIKKVSSQGSFHQKLLNWLNFPNRLHLVMSEQKYIRKL
jgi:hypothetical protein